jgi:hypothetical protein
MKFTIVVDEDFDDRSESCESDISHFSQTSLIEQQDEPELPKFSQSSSLNNEESSSATAIDHPLKNQKQKTKEDDQIVSKDMAMLVFKLCIMVFSPLFNFIMLPLIILTRRP